MTKDSQNINEKKIQSYENHERIFVRIFFFVIFIWIFFSVVIFFVILHFAFKKCVNWAFSENVIFLQDGPINPAEICPLIPPQSGERWKSPETDLTRIFLDVLLELMVTQVPLIEWKDDLKEDRQRQCFDFLFERFKMYYMIHIFPEFNWHMSLYRPSLELPEVRQFKPAFVDNGDGTKKMDPMLACR